MLCSYVVFNMLEREKFKFYKKKGEIQEFLSFRIYLSIILHASEQSAISRFFHYFSLFAVVNRLEYS